MLSEFEHDTTGFYWEIFRAVYLFLNCYSVNISFKDIGLHHVSVPVSLLNPRPLIIKRGIATFTSSDDRLSDDILYVVSADPSTLETLLPEYSGAHLCC